MLKSKLRETGVCLHFRTRSLENACYSSTTCPTLSTLFLQSMPKDRPEVTSFLPVFARFYSILLYIVIYRRQKNQTFCRAKFFRRGGGKHGLRAADFTVGGKKSSAAAGGTSPASACFTARFHDEKSALCRRAKCGNFLAVFGRIPGNFHAVFFIIIYRISLGRAAAFFAARGKSCSLLFGKCAIGNFGGMKIAVRRKKISPPTGKRRTDGRSAVKVARMRTLCASCGRFCGGYKM